MHVMLFLMDNPESLAMARPLLAVLHGTGKRATLVQFSSHEGFPLDDLLHYAPTYLTLSDDGPDSIPRLPRAEYERLCGDDIDFLACQFHDAAARGFPLTREMLFIDSRRYQRLRGMSYRAECILRLSRPDVAVIQQGSEPTSRAIVAKCRKLGVPTVLIDTSFYPGKLLLDTDGMHFFPGENRIDRLWPVTAARPLGDQEKRRLELTLEGWRKSGQSKYPQPVSAAETELLDRFLAQPRRTLFVPEQLGWDASVLNGLSRFASFDEMTSLIRQRLPEGWQAVYKLHPYHPGNASATTGLADERLLVVRDLNVHDLCRRSDAVLTFSSNVGLEALVHDRAVIVAGRPHYGGRGLTVELEGPDRLEDALARSIGFRPDPPILDRYLHHVLCEYLIDVDDAAAVVDRLGEARLCEPLESTWKCPFASAFPAEYREYHDFAGQYNQQMARNLTHREVLTSLGKPPSISALQQVFEDDDGEPLDSGERQVCCDWTFVEHDHLVRYGLARTLVQPGQQVLDLACGAGYGAFLLASGTGAEVTGVDASPDGIAFANDFYAVPGSCFEQASAGSFTYGERCRDVVVAFETIEHLADDEAFLRLAWGSLRPGGLLLTSVPHAEVYALRSNPFHVRHYSADGLDRRLSALGEVAWTRVLGQHPELGLVGRAIGRHLVGVACKAGAEAEARASLHRLEAALPFRREQIPDLRPDELRFLPSRMRIPGQTGGREAVSIDLETATGWVVHGPYVQLRSGRYVAGFRIGLESRGRLGGSLVLDVTTHTGCSLARLEIGPRGLATIEGGRHLAVLPFVHEAAEQSLEFRVQVVGGPLPARLFFEGIAVRPRPMNDVDSLQTASATGSTSDPFEVGLAAYETAAVARAELEAQQSTWASERDEHERQRLAIERELEETRRMFFEARENSSRAQRDLGAAEERLRLAQQARQEVEEQYRRSCESLLLELTATQRALRPYRLVDRLGFVQQGYAVARRLKRKLGRGRPEPTLTVRESAL